METSRLNELKNYYAKDLPNSEKSNFIAYFTIQNSASQKTVKKLTKAMYTYVKADKDLQKNANSYCGTVSGNKKVHFCDTEFNYLIPMLQQWGQISPYKKPNKVASLGKVRSVTDPNKNANAMEIAIAAHFRSKKQRPRKFKVDGFCLSFFEQYQQSLNVITGIGIHPESGYPMSMVKFIDKESEYYEFDIALNELINIRIEYNFNPKRYHSLRNEAQFIENDLANLGRTWRGKPPAWLDI